MPKSEHNLNFLRNLSISKWLRHATDPSSGIEHKRTEGNFKNEGRKKGMQQGRKERRKEGRKEERKEGMEEGRKEGREGGRKEGMTE